MSTPHLPVKKEEDRSSNSPPMPVPNLQLPSFSPPATLTPSLSYLHNSYSSEYCEVPLAKSIRRQEIGVHFTSGLGLPLPPLLPLSPSLPHLPPPPPINPSAQTSETRQQHIPRPPNAFMIYRSELIKSGKIPENVERRQQNLSRLAGQCWNLLSPEEREEYHRKAANVLREHQRNNPNYKFTPAPRGSRRSKTKASSEDPLDDSQRLRRIREKYVNLPGPSKVASRRRKRATKEKTPGLTFSGHSTPESAPSPSTIGSDTSSSPAHLSQPSLPFHLSASLGFIGNGSPAVPQGLPHFVNPFTSQPLGLDISQAAFPDACFPMFDFDNLPFLTPPLNDFRPQDSSDFAQFQNAMLAAPGFAVNPSPFPALNLSIPEEVSPLDTSGLDGAYELPAQSFQWKEVHNPSDDINYAVEQASAPSSPGCPAPSPQ